MKQYNFHHWGHDFPFRAKTHEGALLKVAELKKENNIQTVHLWAWVRCRRYKIKFENQKPAYLSGPLKENRKPYSGVERRQTIRSLKTNLAELRKMGKIHVHSRWGKSINLDLYDFFSNDRRGTLHYIFIGTI